MAYNNFFRALDRVELILSSSRRASGIHVRCELSAVMTPDLDAMRCCKAIRLSCTPWRLDDALSNICPAYICCGCDPASDWDHTAMSNFSQPRGTRTLFCCCAPRFLCGDAV